jgi:translation initiation factor 2 subunit 3
MQKIMDNQPTINIGMIGSVSNGKSSITEKLTSIKTQKHSSEKERNITIKLGYANAKIFKCPKCPKPDCYQSAQSEIMEMDCKYCCENMDLKKHISIIDSPGHHSLMATMLNGASVMDCTIMVESAANNGLAFQTNEHLAATDLIKLPNKIVCMNKLDLVKKDVAIEKIQQLQESLNKFKITKNSPIVPVAANYGINIDILCQYICELIPEPTRDIDTALKMIVVRSFNINKPDIPIKKLQGGVVGGTIVKGQLKIGDDVTVYPGYITHNIIDPNSEDKEEQEQRWSYKPLKTKVISINSEKNNLESAIPGGLIGVKLDIDPGFATKDGLVGQLVTTSNNVDEFKVYETIFMRFNLLDRLNKLNIKKNDVLIINCNANNTKGQVLKIKDHKMAIKLLENPICLELGDYLTLSKIVDKNIVIIGRGKVLNGDLSKLQE